MTCLPEPLFLVENALFARNKGKLSPKQCALVQAIQKGTALSSLYRTIHVAAHSLAQKPVRYNGAHTDGGTEGALHKHGVDNLYATVLSAIESSGMCCLLRKHRLNFIC